MFDETVRIDLKKRNIFIFAVVVMFFVLLFPTMIRFYNGNDSLIGSESYYHLKAARDLIKTDSYNFFNPPREIQENSYYTRYYSFSPYHYLLVYMSKMVSLASASRLVPFILGLLAFVLFNLVLKKFIAKDYERHIVLLLLVINPAFIYTFTVSNPHSAAIVFSLLGFYFFLREENYSLLLSVFCFVIVSLFSLFNALLVVFILLSYILVKREKQSRCIVSIFILSLFSLLSMAIFYYNYTYTPDINFIGSIFSDFGGILGFGIFSVILALYGVFSNWGRKSRFFYFFGVSVLLVISVFFVGNIANMYLVFFLAVAAGIGFVRLYDFNWSTQIIKNLSLLIIVCGLLFSTASYITRLSIIGPDASFVESLEWFRDSTFKDGFVLSHYGNGYLISTLSGNPVLTDSLSTSDYDQRFLYKVQDSMFYSRRLNEVKQLFGVYNIKYVYVTPEMKSGLVWSRPNEGLLFLFTNNQTFRRVYEKSGIDIWEVLNTSVSSGS